MYRYYHMYGEKKYVEPFSNDYIIFAFYLRSLDRIRRESSGGEGGVDSSPKEPFAARLAHVAQDAGLHYVLPRSSLTPLFRSATLGAQQNVYAYAGWKFAFHFLNRGSQEYQQVRGGMMGAGCGGGACGNNRCAVARVLLRDRAQSRHYLYSSTREADWD